MFSTRQLGASTPVPQGPVAYRRQIRRYGPFVGLIAPAVTLLAAVLVWRIWPCSGSACVKSAESGWVLASMAVPTALLVGFPLENGTLRLLAAGVGAVALWLGVGAWAARRSARYPVAGWREYWSEYLWLLIPVWGGTIAALLIMRYLAL
jgi:hypothetical protein